MSYLGVKIHLFAFSILNSSLVVRGTNDFSMYINISGTSDGCGNPLMFKTYFPTEPSPKGSL